MLIDIRKSGLWKSLRFRLFFSFTIMSALVSATFTLYYLHHENQTSVLHLQHEGNLILAMLKNSIKLPLYAENRESIALLTAETMHNDSVLIIRIFDHSDSLLAETRKPGKIDLRQSLTIRETVTIMEDLDSPENLLVGRNDYQNKQIGFIELVMDKRSATEHMKELYFAALLSSIFFWGATSLLGFLLLQRITKPFQRLMTGINKLQQWELNTYIPYSENDDAGLAAKAVNDLAAALRQREADNKRLNDELIRSMRLEVREEKKKLMAKLINTNRMTSLGLLVSSMAHEINNPNGSIRLSNEYIARTWEAALPLLDEIRKREGDFDLIGIPYSEARNEVSSACDNIDRSTKRIEQVIRELRNYTLGERLNPDTELNVNRVVDNAVSILRSHGRKNDINISVDPSMELPAVKGSAVQLEQVLLNLILNASQAMTADRNQIHVKTYWEWQTGNVVVSVEDEGNGIPPEDMSRLFEPFYSTRIQDGGSGLGLYISKYIIDEHGGKITVNSVVGRGTTVKVHLPGIPPRTGSEPE